MSVKSINQIVKSSTVVGALKALTSLKSVFASADVTPQYATVITDVVELEARTSALLVKWNLSLEATKELRTNVYEAMKIAEQTKTLPIVLRSTFNSLEKEFRLAGLQTNNVALQLRREIESKDYKRTLCERAIVEQIALNGAQLQTDLRTFVMEDNTPKVAKQLWEQLITNNVDGLERIVANVFQAWLPQQPSEHMPLIVSAAQAGRAMTKHIKDISYHQSAHETLGAIMIDALATNGWVQTIKGAAPVGTFKSQYRVLIDWKSLFGDEMPALIKAMVHGRTQDVMLCAPAPISKRKGNPFVLDESKYRANKANLQLSNQTYKAISHSNSVSLQIFVPGEQTWASLMAWVEPYLAIMRLQRKDAQARLNNQYLREDVSTRGKLKIIAAFNEENFLAKLAELFIFNEDGTITARTFYTLASGDERTRLYDATGFGFQSDKFLRHLLRFGKFEKLTEAGEIDLVNYRTHLQEEIADMASMKNMSLSVQKEYLGLQVKLAQVEYDLINGVSQAPLEYDGNNQGVQIYSVILGSKKAGAFAGLDPKQMRDAYNELGALLDAALNVPAGFEYTRIQVKYAVMVWIYGAGKEAILRTGGPLWDGIYNEALTKQAESGVNFMDGIDEDMFWDIFQDIMDTMLPGVKALMKLINSKHTQLDEQGNPIVTHQWTTLGQNVARLELKGKKSVPVEQELFMHSMSKFHKDGSTKVTLTSHRRDFAPGEKAAALAPLFIHSTDASLLYGILSVFAGTDTPIGTVHDGFFVSANNTQRLFSAYKSMLVEILNMDFAARALAEMTVRNGMTDDQVLLMNKQEIDAIKAQYVPEEDRLTIADIQGSQPLGF